MKTQGVRGAIITPSVDFENIESTRRYKKLLQAIGLPIVFMDVSVSLELGDGVFVDNQLGAYQAVEAMIEKGYREIGFIGARKSKSVKDRFRGYSSAMDTHGIPIQEEFLVDVDVSTIGPCYETIKEFLQKKKHPQAFFTSNTFTTIGFIKAVSELGMELEKDIACMAFDKVDFIEMLKLKCNYLERSPYDMGKTATQLLLNRRSPIRNKCNYSIGHGFCHYQWFYRFERFLCYGYGGLFGDAVCTYFISFGYFGTACIWGFDWSYKCNTDHKS